MSLTKPRKKVRLGICPIGKFVFSHEDALRLKKQIFERFAQWNIEFCSLDPAMPETQGLIRDQAHVDTAVRYFRAQEIDALFIPHCNFGTEGAAGMIAKQCGVPVLFWGPRDDAPQPDGSRLRDTLCGTLATSKVLHTLRVPFTYINNCRIDDPEFRQGVDRFLRAARVVKTLRTMRVGMIGERIDFFWSTIVSESDLLQRFGVQVQPIDLTDFLRDLKALVARNRRAYEAELADLEKYIDFSIYPNRDVILPNFALRDRMRELGEQHGFDGFCLKTFSSIQNEMGSSLCLGVGLLNELGYPVGPEGDLHGAISSILLEAAAPDDTPSFLPDITTRHPTNENAVLLWHFEAAPSLRAPGAKVKIGQPWILKGLPTGLMHMRLKDGPLTLARFDGDSQSGYRIGFGQGKTVEGPYTQEFYTYLEVNDWAKWERRIVYGPYIHHCSCVYGHCGDVLEEATRFIPGLTPERFDA